MADGQITWQSLAEQTANRLRLLQADLADEPADVRREHLMDEIRDAASRVLPTERGLFLAAIEDRFPAWEGGGAPSASAGQSAASVPLSPTDLAEYSDPSWLLRRLAELAPKMTADQKRAAGERLASAGISAGGPGELPHEESSRLRKALKMGDESEIDPGRSVEVLAMVVDCLMSLDQIASQTWRQMAPQSRTRRRAELSQFISAYLTGSGEVGRGQVAEDVERLRQLVAAMLASISQAGQVAFQQMQTYAPERIEGIAKAESRGWGGMEKACWQKYVELTGSMDQSVVESAMISAIAAYAERLMSSGRR